MINNKTIAVVVPIYNEESQIGLVIKTMPKFVDRIILVNDCSNDNTLDKIKNYLESEHNLSNFRVKNNLDDKIPESIYNYAERILQQKNREEESFYSHREILNQNQEKDRLIVVNHIKNSGVGSAISSGYKWCKDYDIDCVAVMAGDGQMDPSELELICSPVVYDGVDYVKGNRLAHRSANKVIPKIRFFGNSILSILTKIASGYWNVSDTQTGYTAISNDALNKIDIHKIYHSYGMPNDLLVKLNIANCTIKEVVIKPVYNVGEESKMKIYKVIPFVSWLLVKSFFKRLWLKYLFIDFHPLFILYNFSFLLAIFSIKYFIEIVNAIVSSDLIIQTDTLLKYMFLSIASFQSLLFAMWMDMQNNEKLSR